MVQNRKWQQRVQQQKGRYVQTEGKQRQRSTSRSGNRRKYKELKTVRRRR